MLPVMMDVSDQPGAVVGNGFSAALRLRTLRASGAGRITVFATDPEPDVAALAEGVLERRWPVESDFATARYALVYLCDLPEPETQEMVAWAHAAGAHVNVHDRKDLCDFHMPAVLRRGHLQITVSTDGKVAGLSRMVRDFLRDRIFGPEWADRVERLGEQRAAWVAEEVPFETLKQRVDDFVTAEGWLD